jgi:hypothetical protein
VRRKGREGEGHPGSRAGCASVAQAAAPSPALAGGAPPTAAVWPGHVVAQADRGVAHGNAAAGGAAALAPVVYHLLTSADRWAGRVVGRLAKRWRVPLGRRARGRWRCRWQALPVRRIAAARAAAAGQPSRQVALSAALRGNCTPLEHQSILAAGTLGTSCQPCAAGDPAPHSLLQRYPCGQQRSRQAASLHMLVRPSSPMQPSAVPPHCS